MSGEAGGEGREEFGNVVSAVSDGQESEHEEAQDLPDGDEYVCEVARSLQSILYPPQRFRYD